MDLHEAKGKRAQKAAERLLRAIGMVDAVKFSGSIAYEVARDSRFEQARRAKKAKRHAQNFDIFNDATSKNL